jgi:hypothetical protein
MTQKAWSETEITALLLKLGVAEPEDPLRVPGLPACFADPNSALALAAGVPARLGELLIDAKRLVAEQIAEALEEQECTDEKLGAVLVRLGYLSIAERDFVLDFQRRQSGEGAASEKLRLGKILVATGDIRESELCEALAKRRDTGRRIGEELVATGRLSAERLGNALVLQRRLVSAVLIAALSSVSPLFATQAEAGQRRADMAVSATVVDTFNMRVLHQADSVVVSEQDAVRGYIDNPAASRFALTSDGLCVFDFRATGKLFRSLKVTMSDGTAVFGAEGGSMIQKASAAQGPAEIEIGYRFELAPGTTAGTYPWPVMLTVLPM